MKHHNLTELIKLASDFPLLVNRGKSPSELTAHEKRKLERGLRRRGLSRSHSVAVIAKRFASGARR